MKLIIGLIAGIIIGAVFVAVFMLLMIESWEVGSLNLDASIPNEPYYFMEVDKGKAERLAKNRRIILKVKKSNYMDKT